MNAAPFSLCYVICLIMVRAGSASDANHVPSPERTNQEDLGAFLGRKVREAMDQAARQRAVSPLNLASNVETNVHV